MTVLVVEDDDALGLILERYLEQDGHTVRRTRSGVEAVRLARESGLIVLDLGLPDLDGTEVLRRLREGGHTVPVLVLTARGDAADRLLGLGLGADDYVVKPVSPREVCLRVAAILRRVRGPVLPRVLTCGDLVIRLDEHRVLIRAQDIELTPREFSLLVALAASPNQVHERTQLLQAVWRDGYVTDHVLDVHVASLRRKLAGAVRIAAVRGVGYRLEPEVPKR